VAAAPTIRAWPAVLAWLGLALVLGGGPAGARVLEGDTVWRGRVFLDEDVVVPRGVTLTVAAGAEITVRPADSTKIDPEYLSHQTEITVRGTLRVLGEAGRRVRFAAGAGEDGAERWAGIIIDHGTAELRHCRISGAETALYVLGGQAEAVFVETGGNRYGIVAQGAAARLRLSDAVIRDNDFGLMVFDWAVVERRRVVIEANAGKDEWRAAAKARQIVEPPFNPPERRLTMTYGDETLTGDTLWRGRVRINGQLKVAAGARLVIMPGTVVEFSRRDTNGDGIGENGILVQGVVWAKGTARDPIVFRSSEAEKAMGDWDAINILGSDSGRNLIEFCRIEDAYRGLHFHFSNVAVTHCDLRGNFRGMQFQESLVEIRDCAIHGNKSGLQARDSEVRLEGNKIYANGNGANFLRLSLAARNNVFAANLLDGLRVREGTATVEGNEMTGNRVGLTVADAVFGRFAGNLMAGNLETGLALKNTANLEVSGNAVVGNGVNGLVLNGVAGLVDGNMIMDNGSRGVGVISFKGALTGNIFEANGEYALGLDGAGAVDARGNWWGGAEAEAVIYDAADEAGLGRVDAAAPLTAPPLFSWPVPDVPVDMAWSGRIALDATVTVPQGATLVIRPGAEMAFAKGAGMDVFGVIKAVGTPRRRIVFTSAAREGAGDWWQVSLDRALGSVFEHCDFEFASWGIHSHYTNLVVSRCRFRHNGGGIRFRSGPMTIKDSLFRGNGIGLRAFRAHGVISGNVITGNEIGVFIREQGGGVRVNHNTIAGNDRYNMRLGDFNGEDVDARYNWWGGGNVEETVFDGRIESYIGKVMYDPVLDAPVRLEWLDEIR